METEYNPFHPNDISCSHLFAELTNSEVVSGFAFSYKIREIDQVSTSVRYILCCALRCRYNLTKTKVAVDSVSVCGQEPLGDRSATRVAGQRVE